MLARRESEVDSAAAVSANVRNEIMQLADS